MKQNSELRERPCLGQNLIYDKYGNIAPQIKSGRINCFVYDIKKENWIPKYIMYKSRIQTD